MPRFSSIVAGMLLLVARDSVRAQVARADSAARASSSRNGSWSAATSNGVTLMGTWTAVLDPGGSVTGTWKLLDAQFNTVAEGGWSAAKATDGWTGAWRANVAGKTGEYSGTWTATVGDKSRTRLADLFEQGLRAIVSGSWRVDQRSGAWSIRTFQ